MESGKQTEPFPNQEYLYSIIVSIHIKIKYNLYGMCHKHWIDKRKIRNHQQNILPQMLRAFCSPASFDLSHFLWHTKINSSLLIFSLGGVPSIFCAFLSFSMTDRLIFPQLLAGYPLWRHSLNFLLACKYWKSAASLHENRNSNLHRRASSNHWLAP